jgi:hypothetical protein
LVLLQYRIKEQEIRFWLHNQDAEQNLCEVNALNYNYFFMLYIKKKKLKKKVLDLAFNLMNFEGRLKYSRIQTKNAYFHQRKKTNQSFL